MRSIAVFMFLSVLVAVSGCGEGSTTTTTAPTTTTTAPTTTTTASAAEVEQARAQLETDLAAFKASLEEIRTLGRGSTKADFEAVRDNVESSFNALKESAAALEVAGGSQIQGAADQLSSAVDAVALAWGGLAALLEDVQVGDTTVIEAVTALPAQLTMLGSALDDLSEVVKVW